MREVDPDLAGAKGGGWAAEAVREERAPGRREGGDAGAGGGLEAKPAREEQAREGERSGAREAHG